MADDDRRRPACVHAAPSGAGADADRPTDRRRRGEGVGAVSRVVPPDRLDEKSMPWWPNSPPRARRRSGWDATPSTRLTTWISTRRLIISMLTDLGGLDRGRRRGGPSLPGEAAAGVDGPLSPWTTAHKLITFINR